MTSCIMLHRGHESGHPCVTIYTTFQYFTTNADLFKEILYQKNEVSFYFQFI